MIGGYPLDIGGIWWRASRYHIDNGVICAVRGAAMDPYDPWEAYVDARAGWGGGGAPPPYAALLELVWRVRLLPTRAPAPARLTPESEALIVDWCATNGLPGVLLQEIEAVYHAARWGNAQVGEGGRREGVLQPMRTCYTWSASPLGIAGWTQRVEPWSIPADPLHRASSDNEDGIYEGKLVQQVLVGERWRPEVLMRPLADGAYTTVSLATALGPFFPGVEQATARHIDIHGPVVSDGGVNMPSLWIVSSTQPACYPRL